MISLGRFCCVCLNDGREMEKLTSIQESSLSYHDKLSELIPEANIGEIKEVCYICGECKVRVDDMYDFRGTFLRKNDTLWSYVEKLRLDPNGEFVDSLVLDKLTEAKIHGYVNDEDNLNLISFEEKPHDQESVCDPCACAFEGEDELKSFDDEIFPIDDVNNEPQLMNDDRLNQNVKQEIEIPDDNLHEDNSAINIAEDIGISNDIEVKDEDVLSLRTELSIEYGVSNNERNIQDNLRNVLENNTISDKESSKDIRCVDNLRNRYSIYFGEARSGSKICDKPSNHTRHKRSNRKKKLVCKICNKYFKKLHSLVNHSKRHSDEKPHKCKIRKECFVDDYYVRKRANIHTCRKLYQCEICNKIFVSTSALNRHKNIYEREVSGSSFNVRSKCNGIHTGKNLFKCEICNKSFTNRYGYKRHRAIHTDEKPYKCGICRRQFDNNSYFKIHIKTHTNKQSYTCETCNKSFSMNRLLNKHINRMHTDKKSNKNRLRRITKGK